MMEKTTMLGVQCVRLTNAKLELLVTESVGPRIIALRFLGGRNVLAELPDATLDCPGVGPFHLYGGHRLWHAPEVARRTYVPDDRPVTIVPIDQGVEVLSPVEEDTGMQKGLRITLPDAGTTVDIEHTLINRGLWPVDCAPWAITQMRSGGTALLPQRTTHTDPDGLQPNRPLALWPYTDINSSHITWGNQVVRVQAKLSGGALKIGFPNPRGWLAYHVDDLLFVKFATFSKGATYYDHGSSSQCYCNDKFLELETLGPRVVLNPGRAVTHRERWRLYADVSLPTSEEEIDRLIRRLELDEEII